MSGRPMIVRLGLEDSFQASGIGLVKKTHPGPNFIWAEDKNRNFLIDFKITLLQIFHPVNL